MNDEFSDRHRAIQLRLAGQSVQQICHALQRSARWFHKWWLRYLELGPDGLFDLSHAPHHIARQMPPDLERTILTIRRRLEARLHPGARYQLIGANAILAELQALHIRPLPSERTIERVLQRLGITVPRVRLARWVSTTTYPTPQAHTSNDLHQVDLVGPLYLKGKRQRYYILVCKDVFDGAVCLKLSRSRRMENVLAFLGSEPFVSKPGLWPSWSQSAFLERPESQFAQDCGSECTPCQWWREQIQQRPPKINLRATTPRRMKSGLTRFIGCCLIDRRLIAG